MATSRAQMHRKQAEARKDRRLRMVAPITDSPDEIRAQMSAAKVRFDEEMAGCRTLWKKLRDPHLKPLAFVAVAQNLGVKLSLIGGELLEAHFGKAATQLYCARQINELRREAGIEQFITDDDALADAFVAPMNDPEAISRAVQAHEEAAARALAARIEKARKMAPIGSNWEMKRSRGSHYIVLEIDGLSGNIKIDWPGSAGGNPKTVALRQLSDEFVRIDPTEEQLRLVPLGSLWRRGNRTYRVTGHKCRSVDFEDVASGRDSFDPFGEFIGPKARMKRVAATGKVA